MDKELLSPERATELISRWSKDPVQLWQDQQRASHYWLAYLIATSEAVLEKHRFARAVETFVHKRLEQLGFSVNPTTHTCPFDLWVNDRVRVEVKGSHWTQRADRPQYGRYQFDLRPTQKPDVLIADCVNGAHHFFVIPGNDLGNRRKVEITSQDVTAYAGRWAAYLQAWDLVAKMVELADHQPCQLDLSI